MSRIASWLRSGVGFLVVSAFGLILVDWVVNLLGAARAGETARYFAGIYALVGGLHIKILSELYSLRDPEELNRDERLRLRGLVTRGTRQIWSLVAFLCVLTLVGIVAGGLSTVLGTPILVFAWMGVIWALYSLLLAAGWHEEVVEFRTALFERQRKRDRNQEDLEKLVYENGVSWVPEDRLKKFTDDPPPGNHGSLCI